MVQRGCNVLLLMCAAACATPVHVAQIPPEARAERYAEALSEIRRIGRNGDWLVVRGYHGTDAVVTIATNTPWSHAGVLDRDGDQVIEANARGVQVSPLTRFVGRSHRLLLVRPRWATEKTSGEAVLAAHALVGKGYDFLGLVGLENPDLYYCSELAVAVYRPYIPRTDRIPRPVAPSQLHYWGKILYDSGHP